MLESKTTAIIRTPLILMVILIHNSGINLHGIRVDDLYINFNNLCYTDIYNITRIISVNVISRVAVPLFFILSGYYFFNKTDFTAYTYLRKLQRRIKTIVIPYLLWNLIAIIPFYNFILFMFRDIPFTFSIPSTYQIFWNYDLYASNSITSNSFDNGFLTHPANMPLWYIKELMVLFIFAPLLYFILTKTNYLFFGLLIICTIFKKWPSFIPFSYSAVLFFSIGAYISIKKLTLSDVAAKLKRINKYFFPILFTTISFTTCCRIETFGLKYIFYLSLAIFLFNIFTRLAESKYCNILESLSHYVFFAFCIHYTDIFRTITKIPLDKLFHNNIVENSILLSILSFYLYPVCVLAFCVITQYAIYKISPKVVYILTGKR